ncbi:hypothetical protein P4O66_003862 [Electrophorus voltai]|uniref:IMP2-like protein n=1 Tax=Electrophorus voltai TaxID=2609070 RepID=A0AAD9E1U9_9TELE|nr:hypothetical protein P4O66_003862 [Electrophorus voltai]
MVDIELLKVWSPKNPKQKIIKRVIALEGDFIKTLGYKNRYVRVPDGHLWIEGDHYGHSFDSNTFGPRVLLTWIFCLIFLIMLVLKLDDKIQWSWFLVFLPVWAFDTILLLMLIVKMAGRCKPGFDPRNGAENLKKRVWYLVAILLKLAFCLTLCAKLERLTDVWLSFVCVPLWALLIGAMVELGYSVFHFRRD